MKSILPDKNKLAESKPNGTSAKAVQRSNTAKGGQYTCQKCQTSFKYSTGRIQCPKCLTEIPDNLLLTYTEETPSAEMLSKEDFSAGD
jgi:hypothetical protein